MKTILYYTGVILFCAGLLLLVLNFYGLFRTMRNPDIIYEQNTSRISGITTGLDDARREMIRRPGESDREFAIRANDLVHSSMIHYWRNEGLDKYYLRIPVWENYIIYFKTLFKDNKRYEFANYWKKNLERGVGLCSTHSIVLNGILKDNGIESEFWDIKRHVILRVRISENEWYIMDPNYGLFIPHDRHQILENPELVRPTYANMANLYKSGYETEYNTDFLVKVYGANECRIYSYNQRPEIIAYRAKWLVPLVLLLPFLSFMLLKIFRNR
jgi:hypothetical protein